MRNTYFSNGTQAEKNLYEDLIIEQLKIYGQDTYYLPREEINKLEEQIQLSYELPPNYMMG